MRISSVAASMNSWLFSVVVIRTLRPSEMNNLCKNMKTFTITVIYTLTHLV